MTTPRTKAIDDQLMAYLLRPRRPAQSLAEILHGLTGNRYGDERLHGAIVYPRLQSLTKRGLVERSHPDWAPERVFYAATLKARQQRQEIDAQLAALTGATGIDGEP